ncbi:MAG: TadE/TadG family type IV pilus assembly protein [Litorimonas sp.]
MANYFQRARMRAKHFSKNNDGATAIEFALVALPFFALVFAIVELAVIFFINSALTQAVSTTGRLLRVGQFQNCGGAPVFKAHVCDNMNGLAQCSNNLTIDVISEPEFNAITLPDPQMPTTDVDGDTTVANGTFDSPAASTPVVIRATFHYPLALPPQLTRLETTPGTGIRVLNATTAFRTEPFPDSSACPPAPT